MRILGIETSCDETAVCIVEAQNKKIKILGNELYSQIAIHAQYGGVFPNLAKREHAKNLVPLFEKCLRDAELLSEMAQIVDGQKLAETKEILSREEGLFEMLVTLAEKIEKPDIDYIAVTNGPGLEPALWVGVTFAKALAKLWDIPLLPINHMEGHIVVAPLVKMSDTEFDIAEPIYPAIAFLISGGHTQLVLMHGPLSYKIVGNTRDDAVGEAFDKVARILGLPYPGGPQISKLAEAERATFPNKETSYPLPRPMIKSGDLDFSFSGIKTAVLYTVKKIPEMTDAIRAEIAREFEDAVTEVCLAKTEAAVEQYGARTIIIGGGVSANKKMRADFAKLAEKLGVTFLLPEVTASTDNAFMIAVAGYLNLQAGQKPSIDFVAKGNLSIENV